MSRPSVRVMLVGGASDIPVLKDLLSASGSPNLEVTPVSGPDEALELIKGNTFDAVLLDLSTCGRKEIEHLIIKQDGTTTTPVMLLGDFRRDLPKIETLCRESPEPMIDRRDSPQSIRSAIGYAVLQARNRAPDLYRLTRTLQTVIECGKTIVRAPTEELLLEDICRIIVDRGGFQVAWIGFAQHDTGKTILPVAHAGQSSACLNSAKGSWTERDRGIPAGEAIRTGKPSLICGLQNNAAGQGTCEHCSSLGLPLQNEGSIFGALVICSSEESGFDETRIEILQELANDLAFGITALRTRAALDAALNNLEQRSHQLRSLAAELTHAEERERKRMAQAIHDDLQQLLVASKYCAGLLTRGLKEPELQESVHQLNQFLDEAIESSRSLTFELSPPILHNTGLAKTLHILGRRMEAKHGLVVNVQTDELAEPGAEELRILLFQAARELLFNVVKHAKVKTAELDMRRVEGDMVQISVSDSGAGFNPETLGSESSQNGFGLFSIRGRLDLVGGSLEIESSPGEGSRCTIRAPLGGAGMAGQARWDAAPAPSPARQQGGLMRAGRQSRRDCRKLKD